MRPLFFVKDTVADVACEQALCLGKKIARRGTRGKGGKRPFRFSLSPVPRSTEGLFTDSFNPSVVGSLSLAKRPTEA